jgi:hypothetical protein
VCRVWWLPTLQLVLNPVGAAAIMWLRGQPHSSLQRLYHVGRREGGPCKANASGCPKSVATSNSAAPTAKRARLSAEQTYIGDGWNHVVRWGRVVKATTTPQPNPKHSQPFTEVNSQPKVTTMRKTAGPKKPTPKSTAATKLPLGRQSRKQPPVSKSRPPNPQPHTSWSSPILPLTHSTKS